MTSCRSNLATVLVTIVTITVLLGLFVVVPKGVCGEDGHDSQPVPTSESVATKEKSASNPDEVKTVFRKLWSILDTIERRHIATPDRHSLWKEVLPLLTRSGKPLSGEVADKIVHADSADVFAELMSQLWQTENQGDMPVDKLIPAVLKRLSTQLKLGPLRWMRTKENAVEEQFRNNRYVGLGVTLHINQELKCAEFANILPGGAAEKGGLEPRTLVLEVDGKSTVGVPVETLLDWLRGPQGSPVTLKIASQLRDPQPDGTLRSAAAAERSVTLTRSVIRRDSVIIGGHPVHGITPALATDRKQDGTLEKIQRIGIDRITASTLHELRTIDRNLRESPKNVLILDLRSHGNQSDFHQAKLVADALIPGGVLWTRQERNGDPQPDVADSESLFRSMRLVVQVNEEMDEAHVALAAALKDADRAVIIGSAPEFQGDIATGVPLDDEHVLWLNTIRLTRSHQDRGWPLKPDHEVPSMSQLAQSTQLAQLEAVQKMLTAGTVPRQGVIRNAPNLVLAQVDRSTEGAVSALAPANLTENQIIRWWLKHSQPLPQPAVPTPNRLSASRPVLVPVAEPPNRPATADEVAIRVAREFAKRPSSR